LLLLLLAATGSVGLLASAPLTLHRERASATDLALTGRLIGVPAGETRYVRWADLRALPAIQLQVPDEFGKGSFEATAVFLADLWPLLPRAAGADTMLATCADGYASVYRAALLSEHRPFFILEINGLPPARWGELGLSFNPAPYAITVRAAVAPAVAGLLDAGHKRPWAVTTIEVASYADRFRDAFRGRWAELSPRAMAGREIWINSCASCHTGPGDTFGGTKGDRPFELLALHARDQPDFLKQYARAPKSVRPDSKMDSHPHYTDAHLDALVAFITAEPAAPLPGGNFGVDPFLIW
jgi:cytochrome c2